ncbi:hypothetical protein JCGZ_27063 [Jatropha curcas]|uniref:Uncharacterized protein n=1 Tax=Jatropha curcas TaxID=180498 RepID=A0A067LG37_JATCU|nr:hypothetical protein JCGZ_27063 [Jatropha curcas]
MSGYSGCLHCGRIKYYKGSWSRGAHMIEAGVSGGRIAAYEAWWMAEHGECERERRATLTREIDAGLQAMIKMILDSTR